MNEKLNKTQIIDSLLKELKQGKPQEEVKKEFESIFGKEELDELYKRSQNLLVCPKYERESNPLVYLAEENGAIRALKRNILMDLNSQDEISKKMIPLEKERLLEIEKHYLKMQNVVFPFLKNNLSELQKKTTERQHEVLSSLKNDLDLESMFDVLAWIEANIVEENHVYLPFIEDNYSLDEYLYFYKEFQKIGTCLLREELLFSC